MSAERAPSSTLAGTASAPPSVRDDDTVPELRVEIHEDAATLATIEPAWRELTCLAGRSEPFMRPEWIRAWWLAFGGDRSLRVLTVWQGERLVGILPLMLHRVRRYGISVRRLRALANVHSPRVDTMAAPGVPGVLEAIWQRVVAMQDQWDVFELPRLLTTSPTLLSLCDRARSDGFRYGLWQAESSPFIDTRIGWDAYLSSRSRNCRKEIRRKRRQLSRLGRVSLEIAAEPSAVPEALEVAFDIEADGWKGRAGSAMRSDAGVRLFYRELAERMAESGLLRIHLLNLDDAPIAFDLSIELEQRLYSLKSGFRDAFSARSPGLVLLSLMLEHYMASGVEEIDLLGENDAFKRRWTTVSREHQWFVCFAPRARAHTVHRIKFEIVPRLKRLKARLE